MVSPLPPVVVTSVTMVVGAFVVGVVGAMVVPVLVPSVTLTEVICSVVVVGA